MRVSARPHWAECNDERFGSIGLREGAGLEPARRDPDPHRADGAGCEQKGEGAGREGKGGGARREQKGGGAGREQKGEGAGLEPTRGNPIGLAGRRRNLGIWKDVQDNLTLWLIQKMNCNPSGLVV